jgi:hypothetical protein
MGVEAAQFGTAAADGVAAVGMKHGQRHTHGRIGPRELALQRLVKSSKKSGPNGRQTSALLSRAKRTADG